MQKPVTDAPVRTTRCESLEEWFKMKFSDDVSRINPERRGYYQHHVQHFVSSYFSLERTTGARILDFGCGPGFYVAMLAQRGAEVVGVDQSSFLISKARELIGRLRLQNVELLEQEFVAASATLKPRSFDYVLAVDTVVTIDNSQESHRHARVVEVFRSIARIMRTRGRFLVVESHPCFGYCMYQARFDDQTVYFHTGHYRFRDKPLDEPLHFFTLAEMTQASAEAGLALLRIQEPYPSPELREDNAEAYAFRLRFPAMIVYEFCLCSEFGSGVV